MKNKGISRFLSILLTLVMLMSMIAPAVMAEEGGGEKQTVVISVEKFTLGQGYLIEPTLVEYNSGEMVADVVTRLIGEGNYTNTGSIKDSFYLASVKDSTITQGENNDYSKVPEYIKKALGKSLTGYCSDTGYLGQMDFSQLSGWTIESNSIWLPVGMSAYPAKANDTIRLGFTLYGYGNDWTNDKSSMDPMQDFANLDALTVTLAKAKDKGFKDTPEYKAAIAVASDLLSTQDAVDKANQALIDSMKPAAMEPALGTAVSETAAYLKDTVKNPTLGSIGGEWAVIGLARSGNMTEDYADTYYKNVAKIVEEKQGVLHKRKYTEYSRVILGLTAIGKDVTDVAGYNLLDKLADFEQVKWQGNNGTIWALIALDSHNYEIPTAVEGADFTEYTTRDKLVTEIVGAQLENGGWPISGASADIDVTGMALQALARYSDRADVKAAIDKGFSYLSGIQGADGMFAYNGSNSSEALAQVIVAQTANGIKPVEDLALTKGRNWTGAALMQFYVKNGGFEDKLGGGVNGMATEQGFYALTAMKRQEDGSTSLYDMTDVAIEKNVKSIAITPQDVNLIKGETQALEVTYTPTDATAGKAVTWTSDKSAVATVDEKGQVTAVADGEATITATTENGKTATVKVTVSVDPAVTAVIGKIDALGTITSLDQKAAVEEARAAYDALTEAQKKEVTNDNKLTAAEETIKNLEALEAAKTKAKTDLETYKDESLYREAQKAELSAAIEAGKTAIDAAKDMDGVNSAAETAKKAMDAIKTDAQLTAEEAKELADAKEAAIKDLNQYKKAADYREAEKAELAAAIEEGTKAINAAEDKDTVNTALAAAKTKIDGIKTDAQYTAEENKAAAQPVVEAIAALPTDITLANEAEVQAARKAYDALTADQKAYVTNLELLTKAESSLNVLHAQEKIKAAKEAVALNDGTADEVFATAQAAYEALNTEEKAQVQSEMDALNQAVEAIRSANHQTETPEGKTMLATKADGTPLPMNLKLVVTAAEKESTDKVVAQNGKIALQSVNISLVDTAKDNALVEEPGYGVHLTIACDLDGYDVSTLEVMHVKKDGSIEKCVATYNSDKKEVNLIANTFSDFIVTAEKAKIVDNDGDGTTTTPGGTTGTNSTGTSTGNAKTGVEGNTYNMALVVLLIMAAGVTTTAVVIRKKN